ncbi:Golgi apyrase [Oleoguttula sp. CCFEE 5521]
MGKHSYGVVLDAGSSGTRVYVYRWLKAAHARAGASQEALSHLPEIKTKKKWRKKVHPGVSTYGEKPEDIGGEHLKPLIEFAQDIVPKDEVANTPIFLLATAGMRLLPDHQRETVLTSICGYFQEETKFLLPDCGLHVQVIPGETEGLYGWIAANYLLGGFDAPEAHNHGKGHSTYGFLDMGGASAQIAFAPNATETERHANDLKLLRLRKVGGEALEYRVFVTTWLGFGANEARRRYVEALQESYPNMGELPDPCLPVGLRVDATGAEIAKGAVVESSLVGTGKFTECLKRTNPLLEKDAPCDDQPCLLNGVHTPAIDFDVNHFVGVSEYWHTTHELFAMAHKDKAYDFTTYQKQVTDLCSRQWTDIQKDVASAKWGNKVDERTVEEVCFKASWLINMLHDGIGVPRVGIETGGAGSEKHANKTKAVVDGAKDRGFLDPFQAVDKIDGTEVSWTLGKMVLYASSQMPAAASALAVGFGSNEPSVAMPKDFQFPSSVLPKMGNGTAITEVEGQDWHDRLLSSSYTRRVPGILIFLIILALAVYLLFGRERRFSFLGRSSPNNGPKRRKQPGTFSSKLFGQPGPAYERVMEDGNPEDDFELASVSSLDGTSGEPGAPRSGRTSGWATPAHRGLSPDQLRSSPKSKSYVDNASAMASHMSISNGLGISAFERSGLGARTESKERLTLAPVLSKTARSRAGSPRRSPLPFKGNVD